MNLFFQGNVDSNNKDIQPEDSSDDKLGDEAFETVVTKTVQDCHFNTG